MIEDNPVLARYVASFERSLEVLDAGERRAITQEIRNHVAEATAAGRSLDEVLRALGPSDALARAYAVELLLNPRDRRFAPLAAFLRLASIIAAGSFATVIVVSILGAIGISFTASGVVVFGIGILESNGIHMQGVQLSGVPPGWVIVLALPVFAVGIVALALLRRYMRFVGQAIARRRVSYS